MTRKCKTLAETLSESEKQKSERVAESQAALIRQLKTENRQLSSQVGNWTLLADNFASLAPRMPRVKPISIKATPTKYLQEMVALLSDSHANESWDKTLTDGQTEYSFEIFCRFLWYYGEEIVRLVHEDRSKYGLKTLHLDVLGDIYHGTLRVEDEVANDFPSAPGIANTAIVIFQWLCGLAKHFERIEVKCVPGNHGRNHAKPQSKRYVEENKDTLVYLIIRSMVAAAGMSDTIRIQIPRSRVHTFRRLGHQIKIGHGDHIKGGNSIAGLPIYGLSREMLRQFRKELKSDKQDKGIDLIEYGHFHQYSMLENTLIINGAMCPTAPWAFDELGMLADPCQLVYYTSERHTIGWRNPLSLKHGASTKHKFVYDVEGLKSVEPAVSWNVPRF